MVQLPGLSQKKTVWYSISPNQKEDQLTDILSNLYPYMRKHLHNVRKMKLRCWSLGPKQLLPDIATIHHVIEGARVFYSEDPNASIYCGR